MIVGFPLQYPSLAERDLLASFSGQEMVRYIRHPVTGVWCFSWAVLGIRRTQESLGTMQEELPSYRI